MSDADIVDVNFERSGLAPSEDYAVAGQPSRGTGTRAHHPVFPNAGTALWRWAHDLFPSELVNPRSVSEFNIRCFMRPPKRSIIEAALQAILRGSEVILDVIRGKNPAAFIGGERDDNLVLWLGDVG